MAQQRFLNNFDTQFITAVKSAPTSGSPATELDYGILRVATGAAGALGTLTNGDWYILTGYKQAGSVQTNTEIMKVTAIDTSVINEVRLTVLRGQEGTTPQTYVAGDYLSMRETAGALAAMVQTTDPRLSDARAPTGAAGGVLNGTYPNPGFAVDMATQAELDAVAAAKEPTIAAATGMPTAQYWRGDKGWRDFATDVRAAVLTGLSVATSSAVAATDSVLVGLGKLQAQITAAANGLAASVLGTALTGLSTATNSAVVAADTVLVAIGKLQAQVGGVLGTALTGLSTATSAAVTATDSILVGIGKLQAQITGTISGTRPKLTAARTYYVSTTGSDSNDGLSAGAAFLTIQKAIDTVSALDISVYTVTIQLADGTYPSGVALRNYVGNGPVLIQGNTTTWSNVVISGAATCFAAPVYTYSAWKLAGMRLTSSSGGAISVLQQGAVQFEKIDFGTTYSAHITVQGGSCLATGAYSISGGAIAHASVNYGGYVAISNQTVTITGTPAFSVAFVFLSITGQISAFSCTFSGSATGSRYSIAGNSVVFTASAATTYLPGNAAGTTTTGGQYV